MARHEEENIHDKRCLHCEKGLRYQFPIGLICDFCGSVNHGSPKFLIRPLSQLGAKAGAIADGLADGEACWLPAASKGLDTYCAGDDRNQ